MSYRCEGCGQHCTGQMRRHVVHRIRKEKRYVDNVWQEVELKQVAAEVPVCAGCQTELAHGVTVQQIVERYRPQEAQSHVLPVPAVGRAVLLKKIGYDDDRR